MNKTILPLPDLSKLNFVTSYAQIRPYREGGYRIQKQVISSKNIFHNYGHAGSGISLSYGSAKRITDILEAEVKTKGSQCAVLGSGVLGLLTALELKNRGHKVKVYTKKIPTYGQKNNKLMMTSEIAPGFWFPYDYLDKPQLKIDQLAADTMNFLKRSIETGKYRALKYCKTYDQIYLPEVIKRFEDLFTEKSEQVDVDLGNGSCQKFSYFTTVKIDMQLWLKELIIELVKSGVEFIPRQFKELKDVISLKEKHIFNCTGYGSKYLFNDEKMKAYIGHIVQFENPNPEVYNFIFGARFNGDSVRIYGHETRILLGLSKEQSEVAEVDQNIVKILVDNYNQYCSIWSNKIEARL